MENVTVCFIGVADMNDKRRVENINKSNIDLKVVEDFGREWKTFNQQKLVGEDLTKAFYQYFNIFPFEKIGQESIGFDMGCGSGRWAQLIAPKVKKLNCVDPSAVALEQAKLNLEKFDNCTFECASVSDSEIGTNTQDFGYCLGVLHHIPDTLSGLKSCAEKLKTGAPFLLYLYYRFENKPLWFKAIWRISDIVRNLVSRLPFPLKLFVCQVIAILVYFPLSRFSLLLERIGINVSNIPLSDYRNKPFYFLRTDALDRFGTRLEKRFTKTEIYEMIIQAGFTNIRFSDATPYWVAVGIKSDDPR
jgi:SAM-dependent methyltransferase